MAALALAWAWLLPILANAANFILRCKPCLYALAIGVALFGAHWLGAHKARLECQEAQLYARLANAHADLDNANKAATDAKAKADEIEVTASDQRKDDAQYIASLKNRPACDLTGADIGGLPNHKHRDTPRPAARPRQPDATGSRSCFAALRLTDSALFEANRRLSASARWYEAVRESYARGTR